MTNEKKERLKEIIDSLLNSNMGTTGELNYQEMMWFQETIHPLLDRVPSEEEAKNASGWLDKITAFCGDCYNCSHRDEGCESAQRLIRKALGLEGKE